jgi:hypothetical protein
MPKILTIINHAYVIELENMVENLAQPSLDEIAELKNLETQVALANGCHNLMSLPHLLARKTNGKKTISGLFSKPCCNFRRVFEDYVTKGNG